MDITYSLSNSNIFPAKKMNKWNAFLILYYSQNPLIHLLFYKKYLFLFIFNLLT